MGWLRYECFWVFLGTEEEYEANQVCCENRDSSQNSYLYGECKKFGHFSVISSVRLTLSSGPLFDASHPRIQVYTKKATKLIPAQIFRDPRQRTITCGGREDAPAGLLTKIDRD
jgi:hypothetical protein